MNTSLRYDISGRLVAVHLAGDYTVDQLLDLLGTAFADSRAPDRALVLIDARESTTRRPADEVHHAVAALTRLIPRIERMALVAGSDAHYGLMRMGSMLAEGVGLVARACRDMEEAREFLGVEA